jgi:AcrR family transcriptional regulator
MRMTSTLSNSIRVAPQQERSARRLASFLDAAAELFVERGYEATTMTAIAEHSGSSIGALYNYFPDKPAVALALLGQYAQEMEEQWRPLMEQAENLSHREFASLFIERITEIFQARPAYLRLLAAPIRLRRDPAVKRALRANIANAFRAKNPSLSGERAALAANVTLQIVRGLITLYGESDDKAKDLIVEEFKKALTLYLGTVLGS